jgi:hypothetical protein
MPSGAAERTTLGEVIELAEACAALDYYATNDAFLPDD